MQFTSEKSCGQRSALTAGQMSAPHADFAMCGALEYRRFAEDFGRSAHE
jgi:hypothetical protein